MLNGAHVLLGISLSNQVFSKQFVHALFEWLGKQRYAALDVILFDMLEAINYQVFRGLHSTDARGAALRRTHNLAAMFSKIVKRQPIDLSITYESTSEIRRSADFERCLLKLNSAFERGGIFRKDIEAQILSNLHHRMETGAKDIILRQLPDVAQYLIEELAFFCVYLSLHRTTIEVYPGPNMVVKERLFSGYYRNEVSGYELITAPQFIDVSFLSLPRLGIHTGPAPMMMA